MMRDILEDIIARKREDIEIFKQFLSPDRLYTLVEQKMIEENQKMLGDSMREALLNSDTGIIAEFKRRSPSRGWINQKGRASVVPLSYQQHGAAALSILTDTPYFGGYDEFISEARMSGVILPILYKNFIIDEYQLFQARYCGASAVLLIAAAISKPVCRQLIDMAHRLGLEVLLEIHSEWELGYVELAPDMLGVNNRNLGSFSTDVDRSFKLAEMLPSDICKISESGINNPLIVSQLRNIGYSGFLVGEKFMKCEEPGAALSAFIRELKEL
uniref:indole-3-glycerol-phosphate synthase n=2 Tax=unclassified Prevotella TaxID=2638335 RepID=A0AB33J3M8_9BACT